MHARNDAEFRCKQIKANQGIDRPLSRRSWIFCQAGGGGIANPCWIAGDFRLVSPNLKRLQAGAGVRRMKICNKSSLERPSVD